MKISLTFLIYYPIGDAQSLVQSAETRLKLAWRETTWEKYRGHFHAYATFCFLHDWNPLDTKTDMILAYTQSLIERKLCFQYCQ